MFDKPTIRCKHGGKVFPPFPFSYKKAGSPARKGDGFPQKFWDCYLAYSVARLSRMTLTLIWPG